jgi:hypothetical protein
MTRGGSRAGEVATEVDALTCGFSSLSPVRMKWRPASMGFEAACSVSLGLFALCGRN